jgi:hypothetical protein
MKESNMTTDFWFTFSKFLGLAIAVVMYGGDAIVTINRHGNPAMSLAVAFVALFIIVCDYKEFVYA